MNTTHPGIGDAPILNIHQRLHAAMQDVDYIQKEKRQGMRYSIVSHDAVTAKVRPILVKHGIVYHPAQLDHRQNGNRTEVAITIRFVNIDDPTDFIDVPSLGYGIDDQDKGPGKAISYGVKYALLKALGLETGDEPDEDQETPAKTALYGTLKVAIELCESTDELAKQVQQITANSGNLSAAEVGNLRAIYGAKLKDLGAATARRPGGEVH